MNQLALFPSQTSHRSALFSPCRRYRYTLWRIWATNEPYLLVIGLNPSTADEVEDDPTIRRCIAFARTWGFGSLCMTNLFAFRATDPRKMIAEPDPVGLENDSHIWEVAGEAGMVLAAWGAHGGHLDRDRQVSRYLQGALCLGHTKEGFPRHPLYVAGSQKPVPYLGRG